MKKTVLVTGSQGFIGSYLVKELLDSGYRVVGFDNFSKYGPLTRPHDSHPNFKLVEMDVRSEGFIPTVIGIDPDYIIAGAAMIGGITYFHKYAYDLLACNERIIANTMDAAIRLMKYDSKLQRVVVVSSSMVYGNTAEYPTTEESLHRTPAPDSSYGFQKLAVEYFAKAAWEQYRVPYTIVRPFNCVGVGEEKILGDTEVMSGNVKLMMSHVLPDLVNKTLLGQDPLHILGDGDQIRCYTNGKDLARGIRLAMAHYNGINNDFNLSVARPTTVLELAEIIWKEINPDKPFRYVSDPPYMYDVKKRIPSTEKAKELLGFEATITLEESVREVIEHMRGKMDLYSESRSEGQLRGFKELYGRNNQ